MRAIVEPYNPQWAENFSKTKASLQAATQPVPIIAIEHVGSTAVPGLAAKPIIDIDIIVTRSNLALAINALEVAGYTYVGERGIPDRHAMREPGLSRGMAHTCNTYICIEGCQALRNHIAIRDLLRRDPVLRDEYSAVKLGLAQRDFKDVDEYAEAKTDILQKLLITAGFTNEERGEIEAMNQRKPVPLIQKKENAAEVLQ